MTDGITMSRVGLLLAISQILVLSVNGYQYLGCYIDNGERDLPDRVEHDWTSPSKCNQLCTGKRYSFFGLQAATQCFCGNMYGRYGPTSNAECNRQCSSSDHNVMCGSGWKNSLYATDLLDNRDKMRFLGCFADDHNRDFSLLASRGERFMTLSLCHSLCKDRRFAYFGVQAGHECFCGNSYGRYGERNVDNCRNDCRGDRSEYCGGEWRNSVYSITYESTEVIQPIVPEVKEELTSLIRSISDGFQYGVVCDTCLIAAWSKRMADVKYRVFTLKDMTSALAAYPAKIKEKVLRLHLGPNAKNTFEDFDFEIVSFYGILKFTVGMARRVNDNVELWVMSGDVNAYLVPKHRSYPSGGHVVIERRGYQPNEISLIEKGLRYETYKLLGEKLKSIK